VQFAQLQLNLHLPGTGHTEKHKIRSDPDMLLGPVERACLGHCPTR
jgi:hypothetical protein